MLLAHIVYCAQSVRSSGVPSMVPFDRRASPDGRGGLTSQVSIAGPTLVTEMSTLSLASSVNSKLGQVMSVGGWLTILNLICIESLPPVLLAQIV